MTQSASHSSHSPKSQAQRAFQPTPQILGGGGGGAMTARRFPPALVCLLALALPAPLWAAELPPVTNERGAITDLNDNDRLTIEAGAAVTNETGAAITGDIPLTPPRGSFTSRKPDNIRITNRGLIEGGANPFASAIAVGNGLRLDNSGRIKSGDGSAISAGRITRVINRAGAEISSTGSRGISSGGIDRLENAGTIRGGGSNGVDISRAGTVINKAGGVIEGPFGIVGTSVVRLDNRGTITGTSEAGINLSSGSSGTLTNSGTITGRTRGINLQIISLLNNSGTITGQTGDGIRATGTITTLINHGKGAISGGVHGISAVAINRLENSARITGRTGNGVSVTGALGRLENSGMITGGRAGVLAGSSIGELHNRGDIRGGRAVSGSNYGLDVRGNLRALTNSGTISAGVFGIRAASIGRLDNSGRIMGGASVTRNTYGLEVTGRVTTLINRKGGLIFGGRRGIQANAIDSLDNSGRIESTGSRGGAAVSTNLLTRLVNRAGGRIAASEGPGVLTRLLTTLENDGEIAGGAGQSAVNVFGGGGIKTLTNSAAGVIRGGLHGVSAAWIDTLTNHGRITGGSGAGVLLRGAAPGPMTLTNTGTIEGQTAIRRTGGGNTTIDNAGTLRSLQGTKGTALDFGDQGQDTLHLRAGSTLEGQIRWDGEGDLLRLEALGPTRLTLIHNAQLTDPFTVKTPQGLPVFRNTMTSGTAGKAQTTLTLLNPAHTDPRTEATQSLWTSALFQSLAQQQRVQTLQVSANRRSAHTAPRSALWIRPFGGLQNYKRAAQTPAARYRYGGALAGYGLSTTDWQAGAFLGAARSELMSRGQGIEIEGRDIFLGAYGQTRWQALKLSVAVLFGKSRHDTEWLWRDNRASGGLARRLYKGEHDFISPELGLSTRLNIQGMTLIPELKLRYLGLFNAEARARQADGLSFKPEDRHIGLIRASVGFPLSFPENQYGGRLSGQLRVGAEGRGRLGGDTTAVRSGGDTRRYRAGEDNAVMGFVGAGFEYGVSALNLSFSADVEAGYDSEAALGLRGQLGFVWGF